MDKIIDFICIIISGREIQHQQNDICPRTECIRSENCIECREDYFKKEKIRLIQGYNKEVL